MGNKKVRVKANDGRKPMKLMNRVRETMRLKHYSIRTEEAYIGWMLPYASIERKAQLG